MPQKTWARRIECVVRDSLLGGGRTTLRNKIVRGGNTHRASPARILSHIAWLVLLF